MSYSTGAKVSDEEDPLVLAPAQHQQAKCVFKSSRKAVAEFRKKTRKTLPSGFRGRIGVHVHVDKIHIDLLCNLIKKKLHGWDVCNYYDCLRVWQVAKPTIAESGCTEVCLFSFGAAVFWNFASDALEVQWLRENILTPFPDACGNDHTIDEKEAAKDDMFFVYGEMDKQFSLKRDVASLETRETGERLAVSYAIAKSSLLSMYEVRVQKTMDRNSHVPKEMMKNGSLHMTPKDISQEIGRMLIVKHNINLDSSLMDAPEVFWEDDRFEATYESSIKYFQVEQRLNLVNSRLNMIWELQSVLAEQSTNAHATYLEWIAITLIGVELLLDLVPYLGIHFSSR